MSIGILCVQQNFANVRQRIPGEECSMILFEMNKRRYTDKYYVFDRVMFLIFFVYHEHIKTHPYNRFSDLLRFRENLTEENVVNVFFLFFFMMTMMDELWWFVYEVKSEVGPIIRKMRK